MSKTEPKLGGAMLRKRIRGTDVKIHFMIWFRASMGKVQPFSLLSLDAAVLNARILSD